jgi:hypothetical protein
MAENENTEYIEDGVSVNFTKFVFGREPQEINSIKLELQPPEIGVNFNLHVFQQLLQIFTDGFKYLYGKNGIVDPNELTEDNLKKVIKYFKSFGFKCIVDVYTQSNFVIKPDVFRHNNLINDNTKLNDFYYQIQSETKSGIPTIYRVSFKKLDI